MVHSFGLIATDGWNPYATLTQDSSGHFYGTCEYGREYSYGVVFKITPTGNESVLYQLGGDTDLAGLHASVIFGSKGNLYSTTMAGFLS